MRRLTYDLSHPYPLPHLMAVDLQRVSGGLLLTVLMLYQLRQRLPVPVDSRSIMNLLPGSLRHRILCMVEHSCKRWRTKILFFFCFNVCGPSQQFSVISDKATLPRGLSSNNIFKSLGRDFFRASQGPK